MGEMAPCVTYPDNPKLHDINTMLRPKWQSVCGTICRRLENQSAANKKVVPRHLVWLYPHSC